MAVQRKGDRMKIVFVYPGITSFGFGMFNIEDGDSLPIYGISLLAGIVKEKGIDVELIDLRQLNSWNDVRQRLSQTDAEFVGITVQTPSFNIACRVAEMAKEFGKTTIAGGIHALVAPDEFNLPCWDHVVCGDGEVTLPELLLGLSQKASFPKIIQGKTLESLDDLPLPHLFPEWFIWYERWYGLEAARGCFGKCIYCVSGQRKYYSRIRRRSQEHVLREIEYAYEKFKFKHLAFMDVNTTVNRHQFNGLLRKILERFPQVEIGIQDRADFFNEETAEIMSHFEGGGLVWFGFESASPKMLKFINKEMPVEKMYDAVRICKEYKIKIAAMFVIGFPEETDDDIALTCKFVKAINPYKLCVNICSPFPGTPLFDYCKERGLLPEPLTHERFHIFRIFERGLIKGVDYERIKYWHTRIHQQVNTQEGVSDIVRKVVANANNGSPRLALFGAGEHTARLLTETGLLEAHPIAIFDNDVKKWGGVLKGVEIYPPAFINRIPFDQILISTIYGEDEIYRQLIDMHVPAGKIVRIYGSNDQVSFPAETDCTALDACHTSCTFAA
jgi:anaerobic magnesium-protoporphyrin IX monomethyl ester cyclase